MPPDEPPNLPPPPPHAPAGPLPPPHCRSRGLWDGLGFSESWNTGGQPLGQRLAVDRAGSPGLCLPAQCTPQASFSYLCTGGAHLPQSPFLFFYFTCTFLKSFLQIAKLVATDFKSPNRKTCKVRRGRALQSPFLIQGNEFEMDCRPKCERLNQSVKVLEENGNTGMTLDGKRFLKNEQKILAIKD